MLSQTDYIYIYNFQIEHCGKRMLRMSSSVIRFTGAGGWQFYPPLMHVSSEIKRPNEHATNVIARNMCTTMGLLLDT